MATWLAGILLWTLAGASAAFHLLAAVSARRFSRRRMAEAPLPPGGQAVTVLRPLRGVDPGLAANLESTCRQHGVRIQLVCGVADEADPAVAVVRDLQARHPELDISLVTGAPRRGANAKVSNLIHMARLARHPWWIIADADVRVGPHWARRVLAPLAHPSVGLTTCLYRAVPASRDLPTLLECLFVNTDFSSLVMAARMVERRSYAFGATIALHRDTLRRAGGLGAIRDHLADDYELGRRVRALGLDVRLAGEIVETMAQVAGWRHLVRHLLRWARTYRVCRPGGFLGTVVTHATPVAGLAACAGHGEAALALFAVRALGAAACAGAVGVRLRAVDWVLLPLKDLLVAGLWAAAWLGNTVWWGGRRLCVRPDGTLLEQPPPPARTAGGLGAAVAAWRRRGERV